MKKFLLGLILLTSCSAETNNDVLLHHYSTLCEDVYVGIFRQDGTSFTQFFGNVDNVEENPEEYCGQTIDLTLRETIIEVILISNANSSGIKYVFDRNGFYFLIDDRRSS
jgi:hypothetical protein